MRAVLILFVFLVVGCQEELPQPGLPETPREWVEASARHHDPEGRWAAFRAEVEVHTLDAGRSSGWRNDIYLDRVLDTFSRTKLDRGYPLVQTLNAASECGGSWDYPDATERDLRRLGLFGDNCAATLAQRSFREFLLGLPMSALEGSGNFTSASAVIFEEKSAMAVVVDYPEDQLGATWTLIVAADNHRLLAARFELARGRGEQLVYPEVTSFDGFELLSRQVWYDLAGEELLSIDSLVYELPER